MALKGWKKKRGMGDYVWTKDKIIVRIAKPINYLTIWDGSFMGKGIIINKKYPSFEKALAYAKQYMKTH